MGQPADTKLWAVNVHGPDDLIATDDFLTAVRLASIFNEYWEKNYASRFSQDDNWPLCWAEPVTWPYEAPSHAESLAKPSVDYADWLAEARKQRAA